MSAAFRSNTFVEHSVVTRKPPSLHPALLPENELIACCDVTRLRRGGPGGQHRNKVETAVRLVHQGTGVAAEANETRSQERNRKAAISRLRIRLALEVRSERLGCPTLESIWNDRRRGTRLTALPSSQHGAALVAFAFDVLEAFDFDLPPAADRLSTTSSQLVKFLKSDPLVWAELQRKRAAAGRPALR